jgi:hypothetical protein
MYVRTRHFPYLVNAHDPGVHFARPAALLAPHTCGSRLISSSARSTPKMDRRDVLRSGCWRAFPACALWRFRGGGAWYDYGFANIIWRVWDRSVFLLPREPPAFEPEPAEEVVYGVARATSCIALVASIKREAKMTG